MEPPTLDAGDRLHVRRQNDSEREALPGEESSCQEETNPKVPSTHREEDP